jgi:hypothetical protein
MIELMALGRPDGRALEGTPPMTDNNELTPPGRPEAGTETGTLNPEGSRLEGMPPITESSELRLGPAFDGSAEPPGTLTPDGMLNPGSTELRPPGKLDGNPPPGIDVTPDGRVTGRLPDGRTPDGRTPDGRTPDGRTPDGRTPDGRTPDGRLPDGRLPDGRPTEGIPVTEGKPPGTLPGRLPGRLPDGSPPGRPLVDPTGTGDASQTLMAFGPPPTCVVSPELGVVHSEEFGSPATDWGGVLPQ